MFGVFLWHPIDGLDLGGKAQVFFVTANQVVYRPLTSLNDEDVQILLVKWCGNQIKFQNCFPCVCINNNEKNFKSSSLRVLGPKIMCTSSHFLRIVKKPARSCFVHFCPNQICASNRKVVGGFNPFEQNIIVKSCPSIGGLEI